MTCASYLVRRGGRGSLAAADWVSQQQDGTPPVIAMVTLGDPTSADFPGLVERCRQRPLVRSIRIRLVPGLSGPATGGDLLDDRLVRTTWTCSPARPGRNGRGGLRPARHRDPAGRRVPRPEDRDRPLRLAGGGPHGAAAPATPPDRPGRRRNAATRIDAIGTIFGHWTLAQIRPWLLEVTGIFGPQRCMLGSDLPIENLRSGFGPLYNAYDAIFSGFSDDERARLFHRTAQRRYASATAADA